MTAAASGASLWRDGRFRKVWLAQTTPVIGTAISTLAVPLVAVVALDASAFAVGALAALAYVPFLLFSIPLGAFIDRRPRRGVLIAADLIRLVVWASVPIASALGGLSLAQLLVVQAAIGIASVVSDIAGQAILPSILPPDQLVDANAKLTAGETVSEVAGPLVCGVLVSALSAPAAFAGSAASAAASATLLSRLALTEEVDTTEQITSRRGFLLGFRLTFGDHVLRRFACWAAAYNGAQGVVTAALVLYLTRDLHLGPAAIGALFALGSASAFIGALVANAASARFGLGRAVVVTAAAAALGYVVLPLAPDQAALAAVVVGLAFVLDDGASAVAVILVSSVRVALIEPAVMGRVMASARVLTMGAIPIGALLGGALGEALGYRTTVAVGGGLMCLSIPVIASGAILAMRSLPARRVGVRPQALTTDPSPA